MDKPELLLTAVNRLAILGERAGFSVLQLIQLLNAGMTVEGLLELIESRLASQCSSPADSQVWVM